MTINTSLTPELAKWARRIREWAVEAGLDFYEVIFEVVDQEEMNEIASYGGFPTRYPHWTHGMSYDQFAKSHSWGLSKIFELVINNDPCYAYLLRSNPIVANKLVMAHVYGHADFFKHNRVFQPTNRKMMDEMANHATRIRRYIDRHGLETVESFIDACLSIDDLIDPFLPYAGPEYLKTRRHDPRRQESDSDTEEIRPTRFETDKEYMDRYINPPEKLELEKQRLREERDKARRFPARDEKDVLLFLIEYAPLSDWQRDVLEILRRESFYFAPQRQTKIMNEGWASYWHSSLMTGRILDTSELIDYCELHSGTMAGGGLNPYRLGLELYRDIEHRWNTGQHGKDWEECDDRDALAGWDTGEMRGKEKLFEVRRLHNDVTFIDEFLTKDFVERSKMFVYEYQEPLGRNVITSKDYEAIKQKLLFQLTNFGQPFIYVRDGNHGNRGELLLWHRHMGVDIRRDYAVETLRNIQRIWNRPVNLQTWIDGSARLMTWDGEQMREIEAET